MRNPFHILKVYFANKDNWEDICTGCGLCCHRRVVYPNGEMIISMNEACPYLDQETNRCTVYEERFSKSDNCHKVSLFKALSKDYMPPTCAYRRLFL